VIRNGKILAVITARSSSKRVPRKNIRLLGGKPLIAWTIDEILHSEECIRVIVSTDDPEIASVSRELGAEVPFLRPADLASDTATSFSVVLHAIKWLEQNEGYYPELILLLQPTSPLRSSKDIDNALQIQEMSDADAVVSVTRNEKPLQLLRNIDESGMLTNPVFADTIAQPQNKESYLINGAIFLIKTGVFIREKTFYPKQTKAYIMPSERSLDIDTEMDFLIGDLLMKEKG
jgi:CMP-N,N'-diacetyllegionaminic acid synthase